MGQERKENRDPRDNNVRPRLAGNWRVEDRKKLEGVTFVTVSHSHHTWHTCANSLVYHVENLYPQSQVSSWSQTHMSHLDSPKSLACSDLVAAFYHDFRCVCVCVRRSEVPFGIPLCCPYFLRQDILSWNLIIKVNCLASETWGSSCLHLSRTGITSAGLNTWGFFNTGPGRANSESILPTELPSPATTVLV